MRNAYKGINVAVLGFCVAAFLFLCYLNYKGVIFAREIRLYGTDPFYHARRIWLTALEFPRLAEFDWYVNFPTGAYIQWPPGFDYVLAALVRLFAGSSPTLYEASVVSIIATPMVAALTIPLVAWAGTRWFGPRAGMLGAFMVVVHPVFLNISRVGRVDHHVLEGFFLLLIFALFERALSSGRKSAAMAAGASLALSYLFIPVSNLFPVLLFGFVGIMGMHAMVRPGADRAFLRTSALVFMAGGAIALPLSFTSHFARAGSFAVSPLSLFQPSLTMALGGLSAALWAVLAWWHREARSRRAFVLFVLAAVALISAAIAFTPLKQGMMFFMKTDPIAATVIETQSVFSIGLSKYFSYNSYAILLSPVVLAWVLLYARRWAEKRVTIAPWLYAYLLVATLVLALQQVRLTLLFVSVLVVGLGAMLDDLTARLSALRKGVFARRAVRMCASSALVLAVLATMLPQLITSAHVEGSVRSGGMVILSRSIDSLLWLRDNTPPAGQLDNPRERPDYGVLAPWSMGHHVNFYAERPNIANPFGWGETHRAGVFSVAKFMLERDENTAADLLDSLGVRYIIVPETNLNLEASYLGIDMDPFYIIENGEIISESNEYFRTMGGCFYYVNDS